MTTTAPSTSSATRRTWGSTMWLDLMGVGLTQSFYDVGGVRTRVLEAGQGTPVLLLHGTGGHAETYQRTIGDLAEHYRVLVPDMLGHGYTDRPACPYTLDDYAAHLFGLLDTMGIDRLVLSGESLGGCVAAVDGARTPRAGGEADSEHGDTWTARTRWACSSWPTWRSGPSCSPPI